MKTKNKPDLVDVVEARVVEIVANARGEQDERLQVADLGRQVQAPDDAVHLSKK